MKRFSGAWWRAMAPWFLLGLLIGFLVAHGSRAQAAALHGAPLAACEARQRASVTLGDSTPVLPFSPADIALVRSLGMVEDADREERRNADYMAQFKPSGTRDYLAWVRVQQRCYGHEMGLDRPAPVTVEVTVTNTVTIER